MVCRIYEHSVDYLLTVGKSSDDPETRIRALTLGAQLAVFELAPERCLEDLDWSVVDEPGLRQVKALIREHTEAALHEP